jgi:hypothetical protein
MSRPSRGTSARFGGTVALSGKVYAPLREPPFPKGALKCPQREHLAPRTGSQLRLPQPKATAPAADSTLEPADAPKGPAGSPCSRA